MTIGENHEMVDVFRNKKATSRGFSDLFGSSDAYKGI